MFKIEATFFVFLLFGSAVLHVEMCNPIVCFFHVHDFLRNGDIEDYCGRTNKTAECIESCFLNSSEYSELRNGLKQLTSLVCDQDEDISVGFFQNKLCIDQQKYRILACILEAISLESLDNKLNPQMLRCRKTDSVEKCPSKVLQKSCERAIDVVEQVLHVILQPVREVECSGISLRLVWDFKVHTPLGYTKLFRCIDQNQKWISSCIPEKWMEDFPISNCSAVYSTKICIQDTLGALCGDEVAKKGADFFTVIYEFIAPHRDNSFATKTLVKEAKGLADQQKTARCESLSEAEFSKKMLPQGTKTSVTLPQERVTSLALAEEKLESVTSKKTDDVTDAEVNPRVLIVYNIENKKPRVSESTNSSSVFVQTTWNIFMTSAIFIYIVFYNNDITL